jgi:predicted AAA+ superfamily ATPase
MYTRSLRLPSHTFFLFGPRGTGKTTWLREHLPSALWKNLLLDTDYLPLLADSSRLASEVVAQPPGQWVVIDEVQRIPNLLNQVHDLISRYGDTYRFAMSGSSARKLRRLNANLLAGRAIDRRLFPFTSAELGRDFRLDECLRFGALPGVVSHRDVAVDILSAYVGTYLKEEIQQEALVQDVGSFHRFLRVAGIMNGELVNISSIARDASVARSTAERYFDILVDTLVGFRLTGWQPRAKVRERLAPKFYFFDTGVARTVCERIRDPLHELEVGKLLECWILHELRAATMYQNLGGELHYWRSSGGAEVDFVWTRAGTAIGIEVKAATRWSRGAGKALRDLLSSQTITHAHAVYRGKEKLRIDGVDIWPCELFLQALHAGEVLH